MFGVDDALILTVWLMVDTIFIGFDIWMRMRHEKWETERVPKNDTELLLHFLEHDYDLITTTDEYYIVRKFK